MPVEVDAKKIRRAWNQNRDGTLNVLITVDGDAGPDAETVLRDAVTASDPDGEAAFSLAPPIPIPQGWAVLVHQSDNFAELLTGLERLRDFMVEHGVDGRVTIFKNQFTPFQQPNRPTTGVVAGLSLKGAPTGTDIEQANGNGTTWIPDVDAIRAVMDHAIEWTLAEHAEYWITAGMTSFKVHGESLRPLIEALLPRTAPLDIVSESAGEIRGVTFDHNGHVLYERGSRTNRRFLAQAEELKGCLAELAKWLDYALVMRARLPLIAWRNVQETFWYHSQAELTEGAPVVAVRRDLEPTKVGNAYGIQLLGPAHVLPSKPPGWNLEDLEGGYRFLVSNDLSAWFADQPTTATLLSSRSSIPALLADPWMPVF